MDMTHSREELVSRFLKYISIDSQSDARSAVLPSSPGQYVLARMLAAELRELQLEAVTLDDNAIVTAWKRGNRPSAPKIGFIAHLDTADIGLSPVVRPQIFHFEGRDLCLNPDLDIWLRVSDHPELKRWKGSDIIVGDGTSVLGADNKAAIAVIMTLLSRLSHGDGHGDIMVAFVPDEEIGLRGARALDLARFDCDIAYTIDCCGLGEVVLETFNAASCDIVFTGVSAHPMSAKDVMVNPLMMAADFIGYFDRSETPERSSGRDGFFWFKDIEANDTLGKMTCLIRDFDEDGFDRRKRYVENIGRLIQSRYPKGEVEVTISDTYRNIAAGLGADARASRFLLDAVDALGIEPRCVAMRGGTDGAVLTARGIPTPNFFTGAHNFHSPYEFLPIPAFEKSLQVAAKICELAVSDRVQKGVRYATT